MTPLVRRLLPLVALLVACGRPAPPVAAAPARLAVTFEAMPLAEALARLVDGRPDHRPTRLPFDDGGAWAALLAGRVDAALVLREPSPQELDAARGDDLVQAEPPVRVPLARVAVALVVAPDSPIATLPWDAAIELLTGARGRWDGLGGDGPVAVLAGPPGAAAHASVRRDLLGGSPLRADVVVLADDSAVVERVRADPRALGIVVLPAARGVRLVSLITPGGVVVEPQAGAATGEWPLVLPLLLATRAAGAEGGDRLGPGSGVAALLRIATSDAGRAAAAELGWLPPRGAP